MGQKPWRQQAAKSGSVFLSNARLSQKPLFPHRQCTPNPKFLKTENVFFGTGALLLPHKELSRIPEGPHSETILIGGGGCRSDLTASRFDANCVSLASSSMMTVTALDLPYSAPEPNYSTIGAILRCIIRKGFNIVRDVCPNFCSASS